MKRMNRGQEVASDGNTGISVLRGAQRKRTETQYGPNAYPTGSVPVEDEHCSGYYSNNSAPDGNRMTVCRVKRRG